MMRHSQPQPQTTFYNRSLLIVMLNILVKKTGNGFWRQLWTKTSYGSTKEIQLIQKLKSLFTVLIFNRMLPNSLNRNSFFKNVCENIIVLNI